jgi:hypothetical protein
MEWLNLEGIGDNPPPPKKHNNNNNKSWKPDMRSGNSYPVYLGILEGGKSSCTTSSLKASMRVVQYLSQSKLHSPGFRGTVWTYSNIILWRRINKLKTHKYWRFLLSTQPVAQKNITVNTCAQTLLRHKGQFTRNRIFCAKRHHATKVWINPNCVALCCTTLCATPSFTPQVI